MLLSSHRNLVLRGDNSGRPLMLRHIEAYQTRQKSCLSLFLRCNFDSPAFLLWRHGGHGNNSGTPPSDPTVHQYRERGLVQWFRGALSPLQTRFEQPSSGNQQMICRAVRG
ncbi:hypothetical protein LshimejAT787_0200390 [Lyophyllum shimeji]|uniref:Uncharacterized protein n=1 Tax=Lyophyllum shimeji TaxID=47721 RepID=A0A9P3PFA5_LYOSH|nr:hypothetical protein LshimejAT787_0200390 [Lyophyllum shimeji]